MTTAKIPLIINQGTTFTSQFQILDDDDVALDLSGYSARSQLRRYYESNSYVSFTVLVANSGTVSLSLSSDQTANLISGRYVYDVELLDTSNNVSRIIEGIVTVTPEVTR